MDTFLNIIFFAAYIILIISAFLSLVFAIDTWANNKNTESFNLIAICLLILIVIKSDILNDIRNGTLVPKKATVSEINLSIKSEDASLTVPNNLEATTN